MDAGEYLLGRTDRAHVNAFIGRLIGLVETAHEAGLHSGSLRRVIGGHLPYLAAVAIRVNNQLDPRATPAQLCTAVWQQLLAGQLAESIS